MIRNRRQLQMVELVDAALAFLLGVTRVRVAPSSDGTTFEVVFFRGDVVEWARDVALSAQEIDDVLKAGGWPRCLEHLYSTANSVAA